MRSNSSLIFHASDKAAKRVVERYSVATMIFNLKHFNFNIIDTNLYIFCDKNCYGLRDNTRRQGSVQNLIVAMGSSSTSTAYYQLLSTITDAFMQGNHK